MKHFKHIGGGGVVLLFLLSLTCVAQTDLWVTHPLEFQQGGQNQKIFYFGTGCPCNAVTVTIAEITACDCGHSGSGGCQVTIVDDQNNTVFSQSFDCEDETLSSWSVCLDATKTYTATVTWCLGNDGQVNIDRTNCCNL